MLDVGSYYLYSAYLAVWYLVILVHLVPDLTFINKIVLPLFNFIYPTQTSFVLSRLELVT